MEIFIFNLGFGLPNLLSSIRLVGGLFILPFLIFYLVPCQVLLLTDLVAILFVLLSFTDFLDGYLARRYCSESFLGRILDPIADKFLVCSSLIALLAIHRIHFIWVILLVGREICILSLRQVAASYSISLPVSYAGKLKAFFQMLLILILILRPAFSYGTLNAWSVWGNAILLITICLSLLSLHQYLRLFIAAVRKEATLQTDSQQI